jgi:hypothetical protein
MSDLNIRAMIEHLKVIRQELGKANAMRTPNSTDDGAAWLRDRMLKRAADDLDRAINELECHQRPDDDLDAFGRNLKTLEENSF